MSRQPGMKLTLQLHRPRKCLERTCWQEWVFSNNEQSNPWTFHQGIPVDEMSSVAGDALEIPARCRPTEVEYSPGGCASPQSREVYTSLDIGTAPKKRLLSYKVAATNFCRYLVPTQYTRDEVYHSPNLEWMHTEENQPESAATGSGGMSTDDVPLLEGVEPSLQQRATGCPVHLDSSLRTACPGDLQATPEGSNALVEKLERLVNKFASMEDAEKLGLGTSPNFRIWRMASAVLIIEADNHIKFSIILSLSLLLHRDDGFIPSRVEQRHVVVLHFDLQNFTDVQDIFVRVAEVDHPCDLPSLRKHCSVCADSSSMETLFLKSPLTIS